MNDGTDTSKTLSYIKNKPIGSFPDVNRHGYALVGWFTHPDSGYGTKFNKDMSVDTNIELYAHWRKSKNHNKRHLFGLNTSKDTWSNDDKNEIHLGMGSDEYEEYLDDLQEHNPLKPNDKMHNDLVERNQNLALELNEKANQNQNPLGDRKHNESIKRSEILATTASLSDMVFRSVDKSDDERLATMMGENEVVEDLVHNQGKSISDTIDDTEDYIMYGRKHW